MEFSPEALGRLASQAGTLAHPARLEILQQIREPLRLADIRVQATHGPARQRGAMSRQAVRRHLSVLASFGLVKRVGEDRFVVAHAHVFALLDSLQDLTRIRPRDPVEPAERTLVGTGPGEALPSAGPRLFVARGPHEGMVVALGEETMTLGRRPDAGVVLDQDPFVSGSHAELSVADGIVQVRPSAPRNPLLVNLRPIAAGWHRLAPGDVLTVGRSHLVLQG